MYGLPREVWYEGTVIWAQVLEKLLDRTHLVSGKSAPYKDADVGYEVVTGMETPGLLSSVQ